MADFAATAETISQWDAPDAFKQQCIGVMKEAFARRSKAAEAPAPGAAAQAPAAPASAAAAAAPAPAAEASAIDKLGSAASAAGFVGLGLQAKNALSRNSAANKAFKEVLGDAKIDGSKVVRNAMKGAMKNAADAATKAGTKVTEEALLTAGEKALSPGQITKATANAIGKVAGTSKGSQTVGVGAMAMAEAIAKQSGTLLAKAAGFAGKAIPVVSAIAGAVQIGQLASNSPDTQAMSKTEKAMAWTSGVTGVVAGVAAVGVMVVGVATAPAWVPVAAAVAGTVSLVAGLAQVGASFFGGSASAPEKAAPAPAQ